MDDSTTTQPPRVDRTRVGLLRAIRGLTDRLRSRRSLLILGITTALLINAVLLAGYLWSRGGQTVHVRVEARGNEFAAYVDGQLMAEGEFAAPTVGGVVLVVDATERLPSLPRPRGVDSLRVTDLDSGEVLFEDDFSSGYRAEWQTGQAHLFLPGDGVLGARSRAALALLDTGWRDYAVEATYKNIEDGAIIVRAQDSQDGVSYNFRTFRRFGNGLVHLEDGAPLADARGKALELSKAQSIKSLVSMTLRPYPFAVLFLAIGVVAVAGLQYAAGWRLPARLPAMPPELTWYTMSALVGGAFAVTLFLNYSFGAHMPHVPDSIAHVFQAKLLASGKLAAPPPPVEEAFDFFYPPLIILSEGNWASAYPFGHALILTPGVLVRAVWLIPPLVGAASVLLIFAIGARVYHARVGVLAALLLASSPFFLMTASNFMSHNTAAFYLLASLCFLASIDKRPFVYGLLAGLFFGLLFNTRLLTATALTVPFGLYLLTLVLPAGQRWRGLRQIGGFALGGALMLGAYFLYNLGTTGDAFSSGYQAASDLGQQAGLTSDLSQRVGFGGRHSLSVGLQNEQTQMTFLQLVLHGWPLYVGLTFAILPFVFPTRHRWDWFLLVGAVFAMGSYTFFEGDGVMHGPRYWYEATPFLMLLAARGADRAADALASVAGWLRRTLSGIETAPLWAGRLVVYGFVLVLVGLSVNGWLLGNQQGWANPHVPDRAAKLRGFNYSDDRIIRLVEEADLENALVLVEVCPHWWCYGTVFWLNEPALDGEVVFARNIPERRAELFEAYPDRRVYVATYTHPSLLPYGNRGGELASAPLAREIELTTPTPSPTPLPELSPTPFPSE